MNTYTTLINKPPQHMPHTNSFTMGTHTIEIEVGKKYKKQYIMMINNLILLCII